MNLNTRENDLFDYKNKILKTLFFNAVLSFYLLFSVITFQTCKINHENSTAELLSAKKHNLAVMMMQKFDAEMFNYSAKYFLNKNTVVDSLLISVSKWNSDYYLKAKVNSTSNENYFLKLKCSGEIFEKYNHTKSNNVYLVAKINRIDNINLFADIDSLDRNQNELAMGKSILLSGECFALSEIPSDI